MQISDTAVIKTGLIIGLLKNQCNTAKPPFAVGNIVVSKFTLDDV